MGVVVAVVGTGMRAARGQLVVVDSPRRRRSGSGTRILVVVGSSEVLMHVCGPSALAKGYLHSTYGSRIYGIII